MKEEVEAKERLHSFIKKYAQEEASVLEEEVLTAEFENAGMELTHFKDIDTFLYSVLIEKALSGGTLSLVTRIRLPRRDRPGLMDPFLKFPTMMK